MGQEMGASGYCNEPALTVEWGRSIQIHMLLLCGDKKGQKVNPTRFFILLLLQ